MRFAYDAEQVRAAEKPLLAALPEGALMQRAATALARRCASVLGSTYGARVVLLVGAGNNGGDALYAGAQLSRRGARVDAVQTAERVHEAALAAFLAAGGRRTESSRPAVDQLVRSADLVVDGMLGIGGRGGLRGEQARVAALLDDGNAAVVAVDVPSGVDASTGAVDGPAVRADVTVTFGALKTGLVVSPGAGLAGLVEVVDIGLDLPAADVRLLDADDVAALVPPPEGETDKYRRGVVGVAAGSEQYTGAAVMAVGGAVRAGAGMVRYAGPARAADQVRTAWPEAVVTDLGVGDGSAVTAIGRVQAWVVGSGLGSDDDAEQVVRAVLDTDVPVVVDADAIAVIARSPELVHRRTAPTVLTPHAGEFARLVGTDRQDVEARRLEHAKRAAAELGVVVLLKGATTLVAAPEGGVWVNSVDTPYLATAGSGDVLSGVIGALLAGGVEAAAAAAAGAFLHGLAGVHAAGRRAAPIAAMDIAMTLPEAWRTIRGR
ncbi:MAG TPA: NAD(P)H-hydrate dehydratase [Mycobacteriales bacterium]|nr:NAD(P)H-hydrate dehydratase [Mycobacteriales bacterium]